MSIEEIKRTYSMPDIVRQYGISINRGGFIRCPFHTEKTASMKIYIDGFHCFGCGAHGDQIDFVQRMDGCSFIDAYKKLGGKESRLTDAEKAKIIRQRAAANQQIRENARLKEEYFQICERLHKLQSIRDNVAPESPEWVEAVNEIPKLEALADDLMEKL